MSCGIGHRLGLDPALPWLWCRLVATASIRPLAWEPPYAAAAAFKRQKKKKKKKEKNIYNKRKIRGLKINIWIKRKDAKS